MEGIDFDIIGKGLSEFEQHWCSAIGGCGKCPFRSATESCPANDVSRLIAHMKLVMILGLDEDEAREHVREFECDEEHTRMEKAKAVENLSKFIRKLAEEEKED